ncbi:MAG TPA: carboxypeptidase regulatory-like domain-containing protein [Bryobacteraceae bacterium]|nr:carboxypeptidase regulatory-like domain-containing protein [Bryobacteraceae bacterium]
MANITEVSLSALLASCVLLAQQDMGVITGVVTDQSGGAVAGAHVVATDTDTNETRAADTQPTGAYTIGPLRVGTYSVTVEKPGFKKDIWPSIILHAQDRARADFKLTLGQVAEAISVTSEAPILQAETATLSNVVNQREVRGLPLNGRNFQQLAWLSAGVIPATQSRDSTSGFNSNGQQTTENNFIMDGIDNNNNVMGMQDRKAQVIIPSLDAVSEFKVETSNYSAEFGRNSGAVMIVSIKSGSNAFHGTAFEYLRNDFFDSRNTFDYVEGPDGKAHPTKLRQDQYGGTIGGPVIHNRTFFFGSWERFDQSNGQTTVGIVPTDAERNGIFPTSLAIIKDPVTGQPFPGNQIPASRFDPTAAKLLALWPEPNFAGTSTRNNYASNPPSTLTRNTIDARLDHNFSDTDKIFGRFSHQTLFSNIDSIFPEPARGGVGNTFSINDNPAYSVAFSYTKILKPNLVNEFRYGFVRQLVDLHELTNIPLSQLTAQYGINGIPGSPSLFGLPEFEFIGGISFQGLGETGSIPNYKIHQVHQYLDNLSWNHGNHNFKFGTDLHWQRSDILGGNSSHGDFQFNGQFSGISLADFLLGLSSQTTLTTALIGEMRFRNYMFYAQDDWKVTQRLNLNIGLRYEFTTPWWEKHNNMNTLILDPGPSFNTIQTAGYCGNSLSCRSLEDTNPHNFGPRLGLAYQLDSRTVIRAGAGVFFGGQGALGANGREINNFPYNRGITLTAAGSTPAVILSAGFPSALLQTVGTPPANATWDVWSKYFPEPTIYQWNFTVQRELFPGVSLTAAYVGSSSSYLAGSYNWNGATPGPAATAPSRRPIPEWNTITLESPFGHSSYNGLNVQLVKRFSSGLTVNGAYTWSHSIDDIAELFGGPAGDIQQITDFNASRGNSGFDIRQRLVASAVYELPLGKGKPWLNRGGILNAMFGGWQVTNILSFQSGLPFSVTVANALQRLGANDLADWRADRIGNGAISNPTQNLWFNPAAFMLPEGPGGSWHYGNSGRNILRADGIGNVDTGLLKDFDLTERVHMQFRWEVFNLANSPQYADPINSIDNPDFGKVQSIVNTPRQMQFALRIAF